MDTNRCYRASGYALESPGRPIRVSDELQERVGPGTNRALTALCGSSMSFGELPAKHRASQCALEGPGRPIRVLDELQERESLGTNQALRALCGWSVAGL